MTLSDKKKSFSKLLINLIAVVHNTGILYSIITEHDTPNPQWYNLTNCSLLISALVFCGTSGFLSQNVQLKKIIKSTISSSKNPQEEKIQ